MIYNSTGTLRYIDTSGSKWIRLMCCTELARYYRTQINDDKLMLPMWGPHLTVCNGRWEKIKNLKAWRKYEAKKIEFTYDNDMQYDAPFYFLFCYSDEIADLREELGLPRVFARRPLHFTLGRNAPSGRTKLATPKEVAQTARLSRHRQ